MIKVRVKESQQDNFIGFIDHARRRPGDVFPLNDTKRRALFKAEAALVAENEEAKSHYDTIKDADGKIPQEYSFRWMEPVDVNVPEKISTAQEALTARNDTIKQERGSARKTETTADAAPKTDVI